MRVADRRVVITGMGVISPLGNSKEALWESLAAGRSGVGPQTVLPPEAVPVRFAASASEFRGDVDDFGPLDKEQKKAIRKGLKVMCRECQMGVAAAQLSLADAGLTGPNLNAERTGITFGSDYMLTVPEEFTEGILACLSGAGEFQFGRWATEGMAKMSPLWLLKYLPNMPASHLAIYNDLRGPNNSLTLREAGSYAAIGEAFQTIARGSADAMLVGATGTRLHVMKMLHAVQQEELADPESEPARASRPFDRNRSGMVLGEGAGAVVLEELSAAQSRGATIYGEILGSASGTVVGRRMQAERSRAIENVLRGVLRSAGAEPDEIGHLHAHGLSTRSSDVEEARAIACVFGERSKPLPVTAAKSYFGNLGAGSGMVEMIASLLAMKEGRLFAVLNYETPDPECPLAVCRNGEASAGESFVGVSVTPQGQASAVCVRKCE